LSGQSFLRQENRMVAEKSAKDRLNKRLLNNRLIRRSTVLSQGAKNLWVELSEWAWKELVCYPPQEVLAFTLHTTRYSVMRWMKELEKHKLVKSVRQQRGNKYFLAEEIPAAVCDPDRGINRSCILLLQQQMDQTPDVANCNMGEHEEPNPHVANPHVPCCTSAHQDGSHVAPAHFPCCTSAHEVDVQSTSKKEEVDELEVVSEPQEAPMSKRRGKTEPSNHEGSTIRDNRQQSTYEHESTQVEDLNELMADEPLPKRSRRKSARWTIQPNSI